MTGAAPSQVTVRPRRSDDVPRLAAILAEQQPHSLYPFRWPLPFPAEQFIVRDHEFTAFVAEQDGDLVGHVCIQWVEVAAPTDGMPKEDLAAAWMRGHGRPVEDLALVSALFTALSARGSGAGRALLDAAEEWIREQDLAPCLDVVPRHSVAKQVYEKRGWIAVGTARPPWLPDDEPSVVAMILLPTTAPVSSALEASN